ncbi:Fe(2+) transporter permease subunit FeoB [Roseofilum reptotaenium CS-1145]|uniref:Ferrous iron transport protein B n=1 Tax=Roseofilum reptotaenium AO1-A TaxID=1925591 RepID=A0A1L9QLW7_9CYAN|nr:Fe(2+) transporter permease subunit FeoB [Roseofilum reptotaenium]MDB9517454.1 Fe(2+) transporter permease subunit FeoB [Roseofilum reptotaenium CS-1145]OJJ20698.1 ferrous iron transport protein B [Roseofilum reptotaenium AO1-A]
MLKPIVALIGNPNCGKTTLFNALTGANQRTGNWPGVTVDRKEGQFKINQATITLVDLPGVYSLDAEESATGMDELVARDYLLSGEAQLVINIIDASNLERNLYLTTQLMEMRLPMVVALNMIDIAQKRGIDINAERLADRLGVPVLPLIASDREGIGSLVDLVGHILENLTHPASYVAYPAVIEDALAEIVPYLTQNTTNRIVEPRWTALNLLQYDERGVGELVTPALTEMIAKHRRSIHQVLGEDLDILIADSRYGFIQTVTQEASQRTGEVSQSMSDKLDAIVLNRWLGIPIFLGIMYLMFLFTINVGSAFIDFFDIVAGTIFVDGLGQLLESLRFPGWAIALLADGAGGGVQTVATFIPVIGFMFLFLSILEDSGYMARAAFVMDRMMRFVGLPGKSFVPMLVGFGCNVPAIMAARTLENSRDRLMTILMNPFMSCGARLPVYALFAAAFFPLGGQNIVFGLYILGIAFAIFTGLVMKNTILKGEISPFVMELPPYHIPRFKGVMIRTWDRLRAFLLKAGKVIIIMVTILGLLNSLGTDGSFGNQDSDQSILSAASQSVTPIFAPMGVTQENWPATVGIFTGVFAKEAMVGTLDSIYGQLALTDNPELEEEEGGFSFWGGIQEAFATIPANLADVPGTLLDPIGLNIGDTSDVEIASEEQEVTLGTFGAMVRRFDGKAGAFAYLLFVLLYFPCVAATAAVYRETNWQWTIFVASWTTGLAYIVATSFYQITQLSVQPTFASVWLLSMVVISVGVFFGLKMLNPQLKTHRQSESPI